MNPKYIPPFYILNRALLINASVELIRKRGGTERRRKEHLTKSITWPYENKIDNFFSQ
jgi:hypothetical protein